MKQFLCVIAFFTCITAPTKSETLWYSGDFDGTNGWGSRIDTTPLTLLPECKMFERFVITNSEGWDVEALWSNNINVGQTSGLGPVDWSIRSGMTNGVGGTILYAATNATFSAIRTGRYYKPEPQATSDPEYKILVSGLRIHLDPGEYWFNVTPYCDLSAGAAITGTWGKNSINQTSGSGPTALWWWSIGYWNYDAIGHHVSMGVAGTISRPILQMESTPPQIRLAWPTNFANYRLETRVGTTPVGSWETVTNTAVIVGNMFTVANPTDGQSRLFRLRKQ